MEASRSFVTDSSAERALTLLGSIMGFSQPSSGLYKLTFKREGDSYALILEWKQSSSKIMEGIGGVMAALMPTEPGISPAPLPPLPDSEKIGSGKAKKPSPTDAPNAPKS